MKATKSITTREGEVRENLSDYELSLFKPAAEVLPADLQKLLGVSPRLATS